MVDRRIGDLRLGVTIRSPIPAAFVNQRSVDHPSTFRLGWLGPLGGFLFRRGRYQQYSSYCRFAVTEWRSTDCRLLMVDRRIAILRLGLTIRSPISAAFVNQRSVDHPSTFR